MKRTLILMGAFVACVGQAWGQDISPSTLNAAGGSITFGGFLHEWSFGEIAVVSTQTNSKGIYTQGLLQNDIMLVQAGIGSTKLTNSLEVFPNPANHMVNLKYTATNNGELTYRLMDMAGRIIMENTTPVSVGLHQQQFDISRLAAASYLLEVFFAGAGVETETTSFKLLKLQ